MATLILAVLVLTVGQDPVPADSSPPLSSDHLELLESLKSPSQDQLQKALQTILNDPDPLLLPGLNALLNEPEPALRRHITLLVLRAYPDHAFPFFRDALAGPGIHRREAAAHALGRISDQRVIPLLAASVADPDSRIHVAALRGLQSLIRSDLPVVFRRVASPGTTPEQEIGQVPRSARTTLNQLGQTRPDDTNLQIARLRCLDSKLARDNRTAWLANLDLVPAQLKILETFFDHHNKWLGRTKPAKPLRYHFSMLNAVSGSSKDIDINASIADTDSLRTLDYDLDRVIHLRLATDLFFNIPAALSPRIDFSSEHVDVQFKIDQFPVRHAGIGLLNISYWESRVLDAFTGHLRFDPISFRLLEETIQDFQGKVLWRVTIPKWFEHQPEVPQQILIDIPGGRVGANDTHLKLDLNFLLHDQVWLLNEASAVEVTAEGEQLRAYCEVSLDSSEEGETSTGEGDGGESADPAGSATESDSGQGSRAGSPRE